VRRAFLCGEDAVTGRSFHHRKRWLEARIVELANIFGVAVHAYAIMSNHFHLIIETDPEAPLRWSDEEVAKRWLSLSAKGDNRNSPLDFRIAALATQPERLTILRQRLGSLSWYMRYLKEPIARQANREDECTGRFWEGRFRTQALLDEPAVLASMVYVDLNPIRAGVADTPEQSLHTSVRERTRHAQQQRDLNMRPVASSIRSRLSVITTAQYLDLVDWTGRALHPGKHGAIAGDTPPIITRLGLRRRQWCIQVPATESHYWRAIGQLEAMLESAKRTGRKWLRGIGMARRLAQMDDTT
jgi:REP element-mobilizing transposase RayT